MMKKQDEVQQTERNIKEMSIECNYNAEVPKILSTSSQETELKPKPLTRPLLLRKPLSSHSSGTAAASAAANRDTKKRNELFKIWNDNNDQQKSAARQNRSSFFHSCIAFGPKSSEKTDCMKAQERLENVKKEFSKMVNITEDLLKKSYSNKFQIETAKSSKEGGKFGSSGGIIVGSFEEENTSINGKSSSLPTNNSIYKVCGDFKKRVVVSPTNDCSKEEVRCSYERNENNSDYNIANEINKNDNLAIKRKYFKTAQEEVCMRKQTSITNSKNTTAWEIEPANKNLHLSNVLKENKEHIAKTVKTLIDHGISNNMPVQYGFNDHNDSMARVTSDVKMATFHALCVEDEEIELKIIEGIGDTESFMKIACDTQTSHPKVNKDSDTTETLTYREFNKYLHKKDYNMQIIDEELKKRNIVLVNKQKDNFDTSFKGMDSEQLVAEIDERRKNLNLNKQILDSLNRFNTDPVFSIPDDNSICGSPENTATTISNGDGKRRKPDLYDKLDSASATDSNNSFEINERKSQVIHITDLTNSLEDLARLDKICRIIEISDELSDKLFSTLDQSDLSSGQKKWSFKDLCERIKLDEFCNKVFGKSSG